MKTIIAGSRDIEDPFALTELVDECGWEITEVVSGGARGVDSMGEHYADWAGIPIRRFPAKWNEHGRAAGPIRNAEMAAYADALICLHNGSRGSLDMIAKARARGLPVCELNLAEKVA